MAYIKFLKHDECMTLELILKILAGELKLCPRCKGNPEFRYSSDYLVKCQLCIASPTKPYVNGWFT